MLPYAIPAPISHTYYLSFAMVYLINRPTTPSYSLTYGSTLEEGDSMLKVLISVERFILILPAYPDRVRPLRERGLLFHPANIAKP